MGDLNMALVQRQRPTEKIAQNAIISLFVSALDATQFHRTSAKVGEWLSLVEHLVRDQGVGGSNPLSPTNLLFGLAICFLLLAAFPACL
jgi:hypothetical protein